MGCGNSKSERTEPHHGPPFIPDPGRLPSKVTDMSDTESERPRPVARPATTHKENARAALPEPGGGRPRKPDDRVNSANPRAAFQYVSPRGNVQLKRVENIVAKAPAPPRAPAGNRRFPQEYRNEEGPRDRPTHNFDSWEIQNREDPSDGRNMKTYEYPVKTLVQPAPFRSEFDFDHPSATLKRVNYRPTPNDRQGYEKRWIETPNDPGPIRAVANKDGHVIGAMYHPEGNPRGFERARLEPLDGKGRGEVARYDDKQQTGRTTWPQRGPE